MKIIVISISKTSQLCPLHYHATENCCHLYSASSLASVHLPLFSPHFSRLQSICHKTIVISLKQPLCSSCPPVILRRNFKCLPVSYKTHVIWPHLPFHLLALLPCFLLLKPHWASLCSSKMQNLFFLRAFVLVVFFWLESSLYAHGLLCYLDLMFNFIFSSPSLKYQLVQSYCCHLVFVWLFSYSSYCSLVLLYLFTWSLSVSYWIVNHVKMGLLSDMCPVILSLDLCMVHSKWALSKYFLSESVLALFEWVAKQN